MILCLSSPFQEKLGAGQAAKEKMQIGNFLALKKPLKRINGLKRV